MFEVPGIGNPCHDFSAWAMPKALQELASVEIPSNDAKAEMDAWIMNNKKSVGL